MPVLYKPFQSTLEDQKSTRSGCINDVTAVRNTQNVNDSLRRLN